MTSTALLLERNRAFAETFDDADLPILPKLRTLILTCIDARVDPAHLFGLDLGEVVVMRNNGGRVTPSVISEIATLAFMVEGVEGRPADFEVVLMVHTRCGAERFADPAFQAAVAGRIGVDVSGSAIHDHEAALREDLERLRAAPEVPGTLVVSGCLYEVETGQVRQVLAPEPLGARVEAP